MSLSRRSASALDRSAWVLGACLLITGCCLDQFTAHPAATPPPPGPGTGTGPLLPGTGTASGIGAPITFGLGTTPDPTIVLGLAGGPIEASALAPSCYGHVQVAPSHVLTVTSTIPLGRIMAFSTASSDLTLLVRMPSGQYLCNDDSDGLNPQIDTPLYPGEYQIFVGTYGTGPLQSYELGVSTSTAVTASTLHTAVPVASVAPGGVLRAGTATIDSVVGTVGTLSAGTSCTYSQTSVAAIPGTAPGSMLDCQWLLRCGEIDVYGGAAGGGYQPCSDPGWPTDGYAMDTRTESFDNDPTFVFVGTQITVGDDPTGPYGAFTLTLTATPGPPPTVAPGAPPPLPTPTGPAVAVPPTLPHAAS